jgi:SOS response regulatory protein OraA/RecX
MEYEACFKAFNNIIGKNNEKEVVKYKLIKKGFNNSIINSVLEDEYKLLKNN